MSSNPIRIAVVSDLHATHDSPEVAASWLTSSPASSHISDKPIESLGQLVEREKLQAEYLLCCGDITNKGSSAGLKLGWSSTVEIAKALRAELVATAGNHDLDSRLSESDYDVRGALLDLQPSFPSLDERIRNQFWTEHFAIITKGDLNLLVVNTCAYHGIVSEIQKEHEHGRIADRTLRRIKQELHERRMQLRRSFNVLLCHHHPHAHGDHERDDASVMKGGGRLLEIVSDGAWGRWFVVHGHKHQPRITNAPGNNPAIVFGAGSLTAKLNAGPGGAMPNQFYIIEAHHQDDPVIAGWAGIIRAWDWVPAKGWLKASGAIGLPHEAGFGYQADISRLSIELRNIITESEDGLIRWNDLTMRIPRLRYVLPSVLERVLECLKDEGVRCTRGEDGTVIELSATQSAR